MQGQPVEVHGSSNDASRAGLEFAHRVAVAATPMTALDMLDELAAAFSVEGAGVSLLIGGPPVARRSALAPPSRWPWDADPGFRTRLRGERGPSLVARAEGGSFLVVAVPGLASVGWLIWLESQCRTAWTVAENAALTLSASAIGRVLDAAGTHGHEQFDRLIQQQQLEHAAAAIRRVAHDYGNVLTTVLGFNELALAQPLPVGSALHRYLTEVHSGAASGAEMTRQLRLFSRRQGDVHRPCSLEPILAEEQARLQTTAGVGTTIEVSLPPHLPPAAIDGDQLRIVIRALLENGAEAVQPAGVVTVKARTVTIAAEECLDYYGDVRPGPHVELRIADDGDGLKPEVLSRLFVEPFFSTKPCRRGYGLSAVYGVLYAHRGGLRLSNGLQGGAEARVVVPIAVVPAAAVSPSKIERPRGNKVLVVDDDPLVLRFVASALEKAGYRVHAATNATEAVAVHGTHRDEPFHLVLSDVTMPNESGVAMARRLLQVDAEVRLLFMSGQELGEEVPTEIAGRACELLQKPFRSEGLLRAVKAALERSPVRRGAARPPHDEAVELPSR